MNKLEKLGNKCTTTKCTKCPIWQFNHENGAGEQLHNNCVESLRFKTVSNAVKMWLRGKEYDKGILKLPYEEWQKIEDEMQGNEG